MTVMLLRQGSGGGRHEGGGDAGGCQAGGGCALHKPPPAIHTSPHSRPHLPPLNSLLADCNAAKAMRYYRLWIYTCNGALLLAVMVFCAVAARTLVADYRRQLIPGFALHQPSLMCAYVALLVQAGILQAIGCMGALRLNEKLLNAYWLMLLALLLGDVAVGVFWVFRLDRICRELKPALRIKLGKEYGVEPEFTELWDRLQRESSCCGVRGPTDFGPPGNASMAWTKVPSSCCTERITPCSHNLSGCDEKLLSWVRHTADVLFVLGYCVVAFLKLVFLGILRYEIREMIQKIKILRSEMEVAALSSDPETGGERTGTTVNANGAPCGMGERDALLGPPTANVTPAARRRDSDATSGCALLVEEALELREMDRNRRALSGGATATRI